MRETKEGEHERARPSFACVYCSSSITYLHHALIQQPDPENKAVAPASSPSLPPSLPPTPNVPSFSQAGGIQDRQTRTDSIWNNVPLFPGA